jgi:zinc protease
MLTDGTSKYSRAQLADEMSKLKMDGGVYAFTTTKAQLSAALQLAAHVLKEASFPASEFEQLRTQMIAGLEAERNEPRHAAARAMGLHFNRHPKGDYRAAETLDEAIAAIKSVKLEDVKAFHQQFYGASHGEISIVGAMDADATAKEIQQLFGTWNSQVPYARLAERYEDIPAQKQTLNTPDKENGIYSAKMNLELRDDDADYPALVIANYLFGGGAGLNSRVMERIRQKDGLSYGGGSSLSVNSQDKASSFGMGAIAAPQNLAKVEVALREELNRALKDGFTADELARAKSGFHQQRVQARSDDGTLAVGWNTYQYLGRTFAWSQQMDDKVQALTLEQVNAAFRKAIDPAKLSIVIAGDEAKMKAQSK